MPDDPGEEEEEDADQRGIPQRWWYRQRAYPATGIPAGAYRNARSSWSSLPLAPHGSPPDPAPPQPPASSLWAPVGPAPLITNAPPHPPNPAWSPVSGRVSALAVHPQDPQILYLGSASGGVWKSVDGGTGWAPITDAQPSLAAASLAIDPSAPETIYLGTGSADLYAGYYGAGLLKSTDGGKSWSRPAGDLFAGLSISRIVVDPGEGALYVATEFGSAGFGDYCTGIDAKAPGQGLYRSSDGGKTFSPLYEGTIIDLEVDQSATPRRILIHPWGQAVRFSVDGGANWASAAGLPMEAQRVELSLSPTQPAIVYAGVDMGDHGVLYLSSDHGETFAEVPGSPDYCSAQCYYDNVVAVAPDDADTVYLGGSLCAIWKVQGAVSGTPVVTAVSMPGGKCAEGFSNWPNGYVHADAHAIAFDPTSSKTLYAGTDGGVARTTDGGKSWKRLNNGIGTIQFYAGCVDPTDPVILYGGAQDNGPMKRSGDPARWRAIITGDGTGCAIDPGDHERVLVADQFASTFLSKDGFAADFEQVFETQDYGGDGCGGLPGCGDRVSFIPPLEAHPRQKGTFYIGTYRLYRSTNGGKKWAPISDDLTAGPQAVACLTDFFGAEDDYLSAIAGAPSDPQTIYTGSAAGVLAVTRDGGESWKRVAPHALPGRFLTALAVDPLDAATVYASFSGFDEATPGAAGHVFRSTDGGESWSSRDIGVNIPVNDLLQNPELPGFLYAATDLGVMASNDGGASWGVLGAGLPNVPVYSLGYRTLTHALVAFTWGRSAWEMPFVPAARVAPAALALHVARGDKEAHAELIIDDAEAYGSKVELTVTTDTPWLAPAPSEGVVSGQGKLVVAVRAFPAALEAGDYQGSLTVTPKNGAGEPLIVPVQLGVSVVPRPAPAPAAPTGLYAAGGGCALSPGAPAEGAALSGLALLLSLRRRRARRAAS
jgi:photosystem II stability/assembly factor-like uncharacterized protein